MTVDPSQLNWKRTSPVAVVFFLFNAARQFAVNGLPAIAVIIAAYASASDGRKALILTGLLMAAVIAIFASLLHWLRFRFCVTNDRILVRRGLFQREELSVDFGRIQNLNISEPFYMRPFGLASLSIDTAGSGKKEIALGGIPAALAKDLRNTILAKEKVGESGPVAGTKSGFDETILLSRQTREVVIYGLTANFMIWIAIAVGAFFSTFDVGEGFGIWVIEQVDSEAARVIVQEGLGFPAIMLILVVSLLVLFLLLPLISVAGALFRHYGYQLSVDGETYRKSSGLLTRFDESLKRHKIQAIVLKQNVIAGFFKRTNVQLRVASAGKGLESGQASMSSKALFQVPVVSDEELPGLVGEFFPGCQPGRAQYSRINRRRLGMVVLGLGVLPPVTVISVVLMLTVSWVFVLLFPLVPVIAWLVINKVWTKIGYGVVGDYGFVRRGFIGTQTTVFPLFKVQRVDIRQTPGQRRKGLAQLSIHLASHSLKIPYLKVEDAAMFRDLALFHVESCKRAWY